MKVVKEQWDGSYVEIRPDGRRIGHKIVRYRTGDRTLLKLKHWVERVRFKIGSLVSII
jgi:nucleoside-triphosphatase THEP1